ncbi:MAG TPA: trypsin-like peptidase domain-containing protein [Niabella sp.]|nr:trypsin-like peptidase domain-containing protein [Niabella sp.]
MHKYVKKWHIRWRKKHGDNVVGFRVGKKIEKGKEYREYSIIFQVKKKKNERYLKERELLPKFFSLKFPDGKIRMIKTDVIEAGAFKLQRGIGSKVKNPYDGAVGSLGVFVKDDNEIVYALTNFHVARWSKIDSDGLGSADREENDPKNDLEITLSNGSKLYGTFITGKINRKVDVAFVEIDNGDLDKINNELPHVSRGNVLGKSTIQKNNAVTVFGFRNSNRNATISDEKATLHTDEKNIYFEEILQLHPKVTQKGDSGGLVLNEFENAVGLIVGADKMYSYAIQFSEINQYKAINIY